MHCIQNRMQTRYDGYKMKCHYQQLFSICLAVDREGLLCELNRQILQLQLAVGIEKSFTAAKCH